MYFDHKINQQKFSRYEYEKSLGNFFVPDQVIATKSSSSVKEWSEGDSRNLLDQCWLICTDNREKRKNDTTFLVSFDSVIDMDGVTLDSQSALHDNLTKKLICLSALTTGVRRKKLSAESTSKLCRYTDWFFRWKRSVGLGWSSNITTDHFEDFISKLGSGDILDLVPVVHRLDQLVKRAEEGKFTFPTVPHKGSFVPDWNSLATTLGVSLLSLSRSHNFRVELIDRLPSLSPDHADILATAILVESENDGEEHSARTIEGILEPWDYLSRLSSSGVLKHDAMSFNPFNGKTPRGLAKSIGRKRNRTDTLNPQDFLKLLDAAAKWVIDYSPYILRAVSLLYNEASDFNKKKNGRDLRIRLMEELDASRPDGAPMLWLTWRDDNGAERISVAEAVKMLLTACAILIGGFGARRLGEITSLRTGCLTEEKPGLYELSLYIEKTLRDVDRIPVPSLIKTVVKVLEDLTSFTRSQTGRDWLFEVMRGTTPGDRSLLKFPLTQLLNPFAEINNLPSPSDQEEWSLKAHQLRRGFAVAYYHGFQSASLDALSRFLKHFDPEMTRIYINEIVAGSMGRLREEIDARTKTAQSHMSAEDREWLKDAKKLLDDLAERADTFNTVRCEALVQRMLAMWDGQETPIGQGAKKLYNDLDAMVTKATSEVRISSRSNNPDEIREPLATLLQDYAKTHYLEPVPGQTAHCTCNPNDEEDLAKSACLIEKAKSQTPWKKSGAHVDVRPDYAFSSCYVCLNCPHCAAFSENQRVIADKIVKLEDTFVRAASPAAKESAAEKFARMKAAVVTAKQVAEERVPR